MLFRKVLRRSIIALLGMVLAVTMLFMAQLPAAARVQQTTWQVGQIVGLQLGTRIYQGPGFGYSIEACAPQQGWLVKVIGGPLTAGGYTWYDTSRKAVDLLPTSGTGWVAPNAPQSGNCPNSGSGNPTPIPTGAAPSITVSISPEGGFVSPNGSGGTTSIEGQTSAIFPYRVDVSENGAPVAGAQVKQLLPFEAAGGTTDGSGTEHTSIAVPTPPQAGSVSAQVQVTANGVTVTSNVVQLFTITQIENTQLTVTADEANAWGQILFEYYELHNPDPLGAPDVPGYEGTGLFIDALVSFAKSVITAHAYTPQAGDQLEQGAYQYQWSQATGDQAPYLYHESAVRNGTVVFERYYWTYDYSRITPAFGPKNRRVVAMVLDSPATLYIINPAGITGGVDPSTGQAVYNFRLALSNSGDEPYRATIPGPLTGRYTVEVVGTGSGPYTFHAYALDANGNATPSLDVNALTQPGYITTFKLDYSPTGSNPIVLAVVGTVYIDPDTLNLGSDSSKNAVTAYIELPLGFDVRHLSASSITLNGVIPAQANPTAIGDFNHNGIPDFMVKFDRQAVINYLKAHGQTSGKVTLTVNGLYFQGVRFTANSTINIVNNGAK